MTLMCCLARFFLLYVSLCITCDLYPFQIFNKIHIKQNLGKSLHHPNPNLFRRTIGKKSPPLSRSYAKPKGKKNILTNQKNTHISVVKCKSFHSPSYLNETKLYSNVTLFKHFYNLLRKLNGLVSSRGCTNLCTQL